jgi:signal transduction histidine kinase
MSSLIGSDLGLPLVVGESTEIEIVGQREQSGVAEMRVVETEWGSEHALLAVLRDITDRKRAEGERAQLFREQTARAQAEQALRERDDFMALASHELKTPAATLSATAQLLQRQLERQGALEPDQLRRALDRLHEQSRRLARLVEHLLDVSRINSGQMSIEPRSVDLRALVAEVVANCQMVTSHHHLRLTAPEQVRADIDPVRIEQVITNLLDNAIKYSPEGGDIDVQLSASPPDQARISVRDHGLGIAPDRRDKLFERFYRAHADSQVTGLGLGLFIARHLVDLHGGDIQVEAPMDGGTRFTVCLPLHQSGARRLH